jgi:glycosyltransferase involved in cell wall biosynthesis
LEFGHEVTILGPAGPLSTGLKPEIEVVDWTRPRPLDSNLPLDLAVLKHTVSQAVKQHQPFDVVHLHSSRAGLVGRTVDLGLPVVFQPHGWSFYPLRGLWRRAAMRLEQWLVGRGSGLIYCSSAERRRGIEAGIQPARFMVALNAPSIERVEAPDADRRLARRRLGLPERAAVYAFVGRVAPQKAPDRLWRAWQEVLRRDPEAVLLVLGEGEVPDLPGIRPLGFVDDVAAHLDACDALVLLSRWEGLPLAVLDAMARGVPVVASRETIDTADLGGAGVVVDGDCPVVVAEALLARRAGSEQWCREAAAGPRTVAERYDPVHLAARVCDFYTEVRRP